MRFVYCACSISAMLDDWSAVDCDSVVDYIIQMQGYEGGIAMDVGQESHSAITYCAIASLSLMDHLDKLPMRDRLIEWMITN